MSRWRNDARARATADWLESRHGWTHYATLTFRDHVSEQHASNTFDRWKRGIAQIAANNRHVPIVYGRERQGRGTLHYHALVALPPYEPDAGVLELGLSADAQPDYATLLRSLWLTSDRNTHSAGTRIVPYRRRGGAAGYLAKDGEWHTDTACPRQSACRRAQGCIERPRIWGPQ